LLLGQEFHPSFERDLGSRLDALEASDLGIRCDEARRLHGSAAKVGYQEVYSGTDMTLCIFVLKAGAHIPLHDHPHMYVFGRLLFGRMRVISYNPEPATRPSGAPGASWAALHSDDELGPEPTTYALGPEEGNVHELYALEDCAFFDVVMPPYDPPAGQGCNYYPLASAGGGTGSDGRYLLLPSSSGDFTTEPLEYFGPRFEPMPTAASRSVRPRYDCLRGEVQ